MANPASSSGRILVVDDEPLVRDSVCRMLTFYGYEVAMAEGGKEALAILEKEKFDLIIIDYAMPGMKGDQLAESIKARIADQPVLMITASAEMLKASGVPLPGVRFIIGKPFQLEELSQAVATLLQRNRPPS
jgi:CheY-like chemotaxis protein